MKTILIYGLEPIQKLMLTSQCQKAGVSCRILENEHTTVTIGKLLGQGEMPRGIPFPLPGKFALLDGFAGQEQMGTALINQIAPGVIKAVHTPTNTNWRFCDLCSHIMQEHRMMTERK